MIYASARILGEGRGLGGQVLDETDLSGNLQDEYVYGACPERRRRDGRRSGSDNADRPVWVKASGRIAMRDSSGGVHYFAEDFLGSSRVMTTASGQVCYNADFLPYGQEVDYTETCSSHYGFEGKEHDSLTNNDDFGARYYRSAIYRWISPDWSATAEPVPYANLNDPQTLNLYAMVTDNPESTPDPDGHQGILAFAGSLVLGQAASPSSLLHAMDTYVIGLILLEDEPAKPVPQKATGPVVSPQRAQQQNTSQVDKDKFVNYMDQHAKNKSTGYCAMACRKGLAAGGLDTSGHPADAKDYGPFLTKHGASVVPNKAYKPQKGDIVVFGGNKSHPYGHIEVYNGKGWVSDFKQHSMIPYRSDVPPHTIYRFPDDQ